MQASARDTVVAKTPVEEPHMQVPAGDVIAKMAVEQELQAIPPALGAAVVSFMMKHLNTNGFIADVAPHGGFPEASIAPGGAASVTVQEGRVTDVAQSMHLHMSAEEQREEEDLKRDVDEANEDAQPPSKLQRTMGAARRGDVVAWGWGVGGHCGCWVGRGGLEADGGGRGLRRRL